MKSFTSWLVPERAWEGPGLALMAALMLVLPLSHTTALRNVLAVLLIGISGWGVVVRRWPFRFPLRTPWLTYAGFALASLAWSVDRAASLGEFKSELLYALLCFLLGANWLARSSRLMRVAHAMVALTAVLLADLFAYAIVTYLRTGDWPMITGGWLAGVGKLSSYLVMALPFLLLVVARRGVLAWLAAFLLAGTAVAIYISGNRMGFFVVTAQVALGSILWWPRLLRPQRIRLVLAGLAWLAVLAGVATQQFHERALSDYGNAAADKGYASIVYQVQADPRWMIWSHMLENTRAPWWRGGGFGLTTFKHLYPELSNTPETELYSHAHNLLLNKYVQLGAPGLTLFVLLIGSVLFGLLRTPSPGIDAWRIALIMSLTGLLLKVQTDDFFNRDVGWYFWLLAGLATGLVGSQAARRDNHG